MHGATARVPSIRVLCVDDHEVLVEGLKAQFSLDPSIEVVGWLDSAQNLLEVVRRTQPHVVLLDIEMPGPDAFEMADRIHQTMPHVQVIVLTAHIREAFLAAAYKCGASGYFSKADHLAELVDAVRQCASRRSGERAEILLGSKVRERCLRQDHLAIRSEYCRPTERLATPRPKLESLSTRELEILRLIGKGLAREAIAEALARSVKTVDGHQLRIKEKLGISSREDLMLFAIREGLAEVQ